MSTRLATGGKYYVTTNQEAGNTKVHSRTWDGLVAGKKIRIQASVCRCWLGNFVNKRLR